MDNPDPLDDLVHPPNPRTADDAASYVALLGRLRIWAGCPSMRRLSRLAKAGDGATALSDSTISYVLAGRGLPRPPRLAFVEAYVAACLRASDASDDDIAAQVAEWRTAWRRLALPGTREPTDAGGTSRPAAPPRADPAERAGTAQLASAAEGSRTGSAGSSGSAHDEPSPCLERPASRPRVFGGTIGALLVLAVIGAATVVIMLKA
ncbi:hypothetical protein ABZ897_30405 [Nonomuraea sp. NPDC046802]|uniref:hypothetical protein n=1 Tax=Nonomuraea sp. NPDC046802 TaxID=3154919 RepID=UPI00340685C8